MLGIRATSKEDIGCSSAELVFGTTLHLPGEFFDATKSDIQTEEFISKLRENIKRTKTKTNIKSWK